ncbi:MAG: PAS domain-containing protein [Azonexus sp.]
MNRKHILAFLRYFLPLTGIIVLVSYFYADSQRAVERSQHEAAEQLNVRLGAGMLDRRLLIVGRDLRLLAASQALKRYLEHGDMAELGRIAEDFLAFAEARAAYDQIHLLDPAGQELVRIEHDGQQARIRPAAALQNMAERDDFRDSIGLPAGRIAVSPLDLNVENGQVAPPFRPTLRLAIPLADSRGRTRGLLALRYRAGEMLSDVADVTAQAADHLMVVNPEGHFLLAPQRDDEWGFRLGKPELSLAQRYPASWPRIRDMEAGQFADSAGLWTVATTHAARGLLEQPEQTAPGAADGPAWKVVALLPASALPGLFDNRQIAPLAGFLLALAAAGSAALARDKLQRDATERRFRTYFERAMVGMSISGPDKRWLEVNPAMSRILGYPPEVLRHKSWEELTHPDDLPASRAAFAQVLRGERDGFELEKRYLRADGQPVETRVAAQAIRRPDGSIDALLTIVEDISAHVAAEKAVRTSEERLRRLGDNLPDSYLFQCRAGPEGHLQFTYLSSGFEQVHGIPAEDMLAGTASLFDLVDPAHLPGLRQALADSARAQSDFQQEVRIRRPDGTWRWLQVRSRPRRLPDGQSEWDGVAADITARREAEALLDQQTRRAHALLELPWLRKQTDETEFLGQVLGSIAELTGSRAGFAYTVGDGGERLQLAACWPARPDGTAPRACRLGEAGAWADALRLRQPILIDAYPSAEQDACLPPGTAPRRLAGVPVFGEDGIQLLACVADKPEPYTLQDIETIQLMANTSWRIASQHRIDQALHVALQVVNASPVVCFRWRAAPGWPVIFVSDNVTRWGYTVAGLMAGQPPFSDMVHPDDLARVVDEVARYTAEGRNDYLQEYRLLTGDGRFIWVSDRTQVGRNASGEVEFYDGVLTDITERRAQTEELTAMLAAQRQLNKRLEEAHNQLLQSEKMASIGQLAAGIAHELNNPIGFVHSNLGTLESYLRDVMEIIDAYDQSLSGEGDLAARQAAIARLREERDFDYLRHDIVQLLSESKDGLTRVRKIVQDLKTFSHVSEQEWQWADLHQGLDSTLNIVWNELKYKCQVVKEYGDLPPVYCLISQLNQVFMNLLVNASHAIESKGTITIRTRREGNDAVCIEIADTGKGIAPEHLTRIFEPFFTTKPVGKGTGLGLSLSYGIINRHHGRIEVESELGVGTTFRVILPINPPDHSPETSR